MKRIATSYDSLGRRSLVTSYDAASSGSVTDEVNFTYDSWGNVEKYEQDNDSTVGGSGVTDYEVAYEYTKNAGDGRNTVRKTKQTLPGGERVDYQYLTSSNRLDGYLSRVTRIRDIGPVSVPPAVPFTIVEYKYNGEGEVVGTEYAENSVKRERFSTTGLYPAFDNFNRIKKDTWVKDLATDRAIYDCDLVYDRNSNIVRIDDHVHKTKFDAVYTMDDRDRLIDAQEGDLNGGSSISTESRQQTWTLTQTGNWELEKLDLNGDGDWSDTDEYQDDRTHNEVNELLDRDTDDNGTPNYTLSYDEAGNLIDDGEDYKYEYDAFYRLRKIKERLTPFDLVAEYRYNGLGFRIAEHVDTDTDGDVDGSDAWHHFAHDERWRVVAMFINSSTDPEEQYVHHTAGADGFGASSYIDELVLRDRDAVGDINNTLDERLYYLQNRHFDVVALIDDNGKQVEMVRYLAYGMPFGLAGGDCDSDGDCNYGDTTDTDQIQTWINGSVYDVRGDMDLDGDVDAGDKAIAQAAPFANVSAGFGSQTSALVLNRMGTTGHIASLVPMSGSYFTRHRHLLARIGRFAQRDPYGHTDGPGLYCYVGDRPTVRVDPTGQFALPSMFRPCIAAQTSSGEDAGGYRMKVILKVVESNPTECDYTTGCYWKILLGLSIDPNPPGSKTEDEEYRDWHSNDGDDDSSNTYPQWTKSANAPPWNPLNPNDASPDFPQGSSDVRQELEFRLSCQGEERYRYTATPPPGSPAASLSGDVYLYCRWCNRGRLDWAASSNTNQN